MRLILHYRGPLKPNGDPTHKHDLRKIFHAQLKKLWTQKPLSEMPRLLDPRNSVIANDYSLLRPMGSFTFVPLITEEMDVVAELAITILRPEPPGGLIAQGGDIDNRLKTLFDALTIPRHSNQLLPGSHPDADQEPFFCLLEDDNLITAVSVRTEQLLEPGINQSDADLTIQVRTRVTQQTIGNSIFS